MTNHIAIQSLKKALRKHMKTDILKAVSAECRSKQSKIITEKVLQSQAFRKAQRISIYLSTSTEVDTSELLREMFRLEKQVFVPTYNKNEMHMVRLRDWDDYDNLPLTKWKIKQPSSTEGREDAMTNGHGIDLFLLPGVAFSKGGGRLGHGMGYYDRYLKHHYTTYPHKKTTLIGLAFCEQIVEEEVLPLEPHDVRMHCIITP